LACWTRRARSSPALSTARSACTSWPPVNVEEVNEVLPALFEAADVRGRLFGAGELLVVLENLVLEPLQVEHRLALARLEGFDHLLAHAVALFEQPLAVAPVHEAAVERAGRHGRQVRALGDERRGERDGRPGVGRRDRETRHPPEVDGFHERLFQVFETDLFLGHKTLAFDECRND
jgi:hypothetical protein